MSPKLLTRGDWRSADRASTVVLSGRRTIAVDGKVLRGFRSTDAADAAARDLMAARDQTSSVVLADTDVDVKTNAITRESRKEERESRAIC